MSDETQGTPPVPPVAPAPGQGATQGPSDTGKILAGIGYLTGIVALIAILIEPYKDEKFVRLHALQALGLWVGWIVISMIAAIPVLGWIIAAIGWVVLLAFSIMGAIKAFQGQWWEMPVVNAFIKQYI